MIVLVNSVSKYRILIEVIFKNKDLQLHHKCYNCKHKHSGWVPPWWLSSLRLFHQLCWYNIEVMLVLNLFISLSDVPIHLQLYWLHCRDMPSGLCQWLHLHIWLRLRHGIHQLLCTLLLCWKNQRIYLWIYTLKMHFLYVDLTHKNGIFINAFHLFFVSNNAK